MNRNTASLIKTARAMSKNVKSAAQGKSFLQRANFAGFKTCVPRVASNSFMKFNSFGMRSFSSLPDHIKLEMPNLSPTMEKVSFFTE